MSPRRLLQGILGRRRSPSERDNDDAEAAAKNYWQAKVEEEKEHPLPKASRTDAERTAQESAQRYWQREVADEKKRRGTPDKPRR